MQSNTIPLRLIRAPEVFELTGLRRTTIYEKVKAGDFPAPVKLSVRSVAWRLAEVEDWINSRQSTRPALATVGNMA